MLLHKPPLMNSIKLHIFTDSVFLRSTCQQSSLRRLGRMPAPPGNGSERSLRWWTSGRHACRKGW